MGSVSRVAKLTTIAQTGYPRATFAYPPSPPLPNPVPGELTMRKKPLVLLLSLLCALSCPAQGLRNGGFEEVAGKRSASWAFAGKSEMVENAQLAHGGTRCIKARFDDGVTQSLPVERGAAYRLSGWIRRAEAGGKEVPKIKVYFKAADNRRLDVQAAVFQNVPHGRWLRWETVCQAPRNAATMDLTLRGFFGGTEWFYYDDLAIERIEAPGWLPPGEAPDLNHKIVTIPDVVDVWTDALLRIPPGSLLPIDGRIDTAVRLRGEKVRIQLTKSNPPQTNHVQFHTLRPGMALGEVELAVSGKPIARSDDRKELVRALSFPTARWHEATLRLPKDREVYLNEIQFAMIKHDVKMAGEPQALSLHVTPAGKQATQVVHKAFADDSDRDMLFAKTGPTTGRKVLAADTYLHIVLPPADQQTGLAGVGIDLALPDAPDGSLLEVTLRLPEELDRNIRWTTTTDRGLKPREQERNYATACRIVGRINKGRFNPNIDVPDLLYPAGESVWLTLRADREMAIDLAKSGLTVYRLPPSRAVSGHAPQLERLVRRMYTDATEAHVYDSRPWNQLTIGTYVKRLLELDPGNPAGTRIYRRIALVREPIKLDRPGPADAPDWAVWAREALRRRHDMISWWLANRQQANGELAGHINDDGEFSCNWPSHYLMTGDPRIADGLRKLADVAWKMSGDTGYTVGARDVEHAAEDQSCTQPQVLLVDYGNPQTVERLMTMSSYLNLWTAINDKGRRQFRAYMFNTTKVWDEPPFDVDHAYCPLAMVGTGHLVWYAKQGNVTDVFLEEAASWAKGVLSTEDGKPAGQIPREIRFRDSKINPYAPYPSHPLLQKRNTLYRGNAGAYIVRYFLTGAATLSEDQLFQQVMDLWTPAKEEILAKARSTLKGFTEQLAKPKGPERRYSQPASAFTSFAPPMRRLFGGTAVGTATGEKEGTAQCTVEVTVAGRYAVWALLGRVDQKEEGLRPKTFFVTVDDRPLDRIRIHAPAAEWTPAVTIHTYELAAGTHTIQLRGRTPGSAIREIGFTTQYSLEGMWKPRQSETALYDAWRATGDRTWLVEELKEAVRQQQRNHWLLTEAEPYTDRIPVPGQNLLSRVFLGDWTSGKSHVPGHWISWENAGVDYAALVLTARRDRLTVLFHSFHEKARPITLRTWRLPHGMYDITTGIDTNGDDQPDQAVQRSSQELWRHDGALTFAAQPNQTHVVDLRLTKQLDDIRLRPDLAIGQPDVQISDGKLTMTVHSIGGAPTPPARLTVQDTQGDTLGTAPIPSLPAPHDLQPKTARISIPLLNGAQPATVEITSSSPEITLANNRLALARQTE